MKTLSLFLLLFSFSESKSQSVYEIEHWEMSGGGIFKKTKTFSIEKTDKLGRIVSMQTFDKKKLVTDETWVYEKDLLTATKIQYYSGGSYAQRTYSWLNEQGRKIKEYCVAPFPWDDTLYFFYDNKGRLSRTSQEFKNKKHDVKIRVSNYYYNANDSLVKRVDSSDLIGSKTIYLYQYENVGPLVKKTELLDRGKRKPIRNHVYYYDSKGNLVREFAQNKPLEPPPTACEYVFDENGVWVTKRISIMYNTTELRRRKL